MPLFEVKDLSKTYNDGLVETPVLKNLSFDIDEGEFVSIMGPSGSGKSTLLHILGFLLELTGGKYIFNGKEYQNYSEDEAAEVRNAEMGFVFQSFNLLPRQSIAENVMLPLMYSRRPESEWRNRVEEVVDIVGLTHRINYQTLKLSGGEKQRVAIARALVNKPAVVFADEPTGNLDSTSGKVVMQTLQRLHNELGHTIVLITHETYTAEHADRMIYLEDGEIKSDRPVENRRLAQDFFNK